MANQRKNKEDRFDSHTNNNTGKQSKQGGHTPGSKPGQNGKQGQAGSHSQNNKQSQNGKQSQAGGHSQNSKQGQNGKQGQAGSHSQNNKQSQNGKQNQYSKQNPYEKADTTMKQTYPEKPEAEQAFPVTEEEADDIRVTVDLEDGTTEECMILTIMEVSGQDYIALLPVNEKDQPNEEGRVYLYRYFEDEKGLPYLENIEDDDEYEIAFDAFDEWQDEMLFDSME